MPAAERPLAGQRVVVTRAAHQARGLVDRLITLGAGVETLPLLEIVAPDEPARLERAASELALFRWLVLTSANAVDALMEAAGGALPPGIKVAVIGGRTAAALAAWEIQPDLEASDSSAEGLAEALAPHLGRQQRLLLPQAADARPVLAQLLVAAGAEVVRVDAYAKRVPPDAKASASRIFGEGAPLWVTFTSPSTVRHLAQVLGSRWREAKETLRAVSIGPITSGELRRLGVGPIHEAASPSDEGLVETLMASVLNSADGVSEERSGSR